MSDTQSQTTSSERTKVGFPEAPSPEEKRGFNFGALFIFLLILILVGGGVWFMFFRNKSMTNTLEETTETPTIEEVVEESPTPVLLNKENVKIQILNGSGVPGLAGKLQTVLQDAGYSGIETGNADSYTYTKTLVAFDSTVSEEIKADITNALEKLYGTVDIKTNSSTRYNVIITIGYPKGYTPSPIIKPSATSIITPTSTTGTSGTVTPTKKPSITQTPTP